MIAVVNASVSVPILILDATGSGKAGLTVAASARLAGSSTTANATVTERTGGQYDIAFTPSAVGQWIVTATATVDGDPFTDVELVQAVTAAQFDPASYLAAGGVTVVSPVDATTGDVTIYQGDDYAAAESRRLSWLTNGDWPDLTGASIAFSAVHTIDRTQTLSASGSVVDPSGSDAQVAVALTHAQTAALSTGGYTYAVIATLSNTNVVTLAAGSLAVVARP